MAQYSVQDEAKRPLLSPQPDQVMRFDTNDADFVDRLREIAECHIAKEGYEAEGEIARDKCHKLKNDMCEVERQNPQMVFEGNGPSTFTKRLRIVCWPGFWVSPYLKDRIWELRNIIRADTVKDEPQLTAEEREALISVLDDISLIDKISRWAIFLFMFVMWLLFVYLIQWTSSKGGIEKV